MSKIRYISSTLEKKRLEDSISIGQDLWWGGAFDDLVYQLKSGLMEPENVRFFYRL